MKTRTCVICFKAATNWTGHIHNGSEIVTAGFCDDHISDVDFTRESVHDECPGCVGDTTRRDKIVIDDVA